jgi:hypothetical protein
MLQPSRIGRFAAVIGVHAAQSHALYNYKQGILRLHALWYGKATRRRSHGAPQQVALRSPLIPRKCVVPENSLQSETPCNYKSFERWKSGNESHKTIIVSGKEFGILRMEIYGAGLISIFFAR